MIKYLMLFMLLSVAIFYPAQGDTSLFNQTITVPASGYYDFHQDTNITSGSGLYGHISITGFVNGANFLIFTPENFEIWLVNNSIWNARYALTNVTNENIKFRAPEDSAYHFVVDNTKVNISQQVTFSLSIDHTAPNVIANNLDTVPSYGKYTLKVNITDNAFNIANTSLLIDGEVKTSFNTEQPLHTLQYIWNVEGALDGNHNVSIYCKDVLGNNATYTYWVYILHEHIITTPVVVTLEGTLTVILVFGGFAAIVGIVIRQLIRWYSPK